MLNSAGNRALGRFLRSVDVKGLSLSKTPKSLVMRARSWRVGFPPGVPQRWGELRQKGWREDQCSMLKSAGNRAFGLSTRADVKWPTGLTFEDAEIGGDAARGMAFPLEVGYGGTVSAFSLAARRRAPWPTSITFQ